MNELYRHRTQPDVTTSLCFFYEKNNSLLPSPVCSFLGSLSSLPSHPLRPHNPAFPSPTPAPPRPHPPNHPLPASCKRVHRYCSAKRDRGGLVRRSPSSLSGVQLVRFSRLPPEGSSASHVKRLAVGPQGGEVPFRWDFARVLFVFSAFDISFMFKFVIASLFAFLFSLSSSL